jgi:hypothetical protein
MLPLLVAMLALASLSVVILREGGGSASLLAVRSIRRKETRGWSAFADHDEIKLRKA